MAIHTRSLSALIAVVAGGACALFRGGIQPTYPLVVNNKSDFEVVVYAIQSAGSNGIRLGNARTFSVTTMQVPRNALQGSQTLVLKLHSIGAVKTCPGVSAACNRTPVFYTGPATVDSGVVVHLDIRADHNGGLSNSLLYSSVAPGNDTTLHEAAKPPT